MAMEGIYVIPLFAETHNEFPLVKSQNLMSGLGSVKSYAQIYLQTLAE